MAPSGRRASAPTARRTRPKNRKAQIATVAAVAFSERGYHGVGVDDIAAELGISGPALYRHFPNKYALFVHAASSAAAGLAAAVAAAEESTPEDDPGARLDAVVRGLVSASVENRRVGGLYRWERRYLVGDDREALRAVFVSITRSVAAPLRALRPELSNADTTVLAAATLSAIGSVTAHRTALAQRRLAALIESIARAVLFAELGPQQPVPPEAPKNGLGVTSKREMLVAEAVRVFDLHGYHDATVEEIGAGAGINASSVYRYFPSKSDLLAAVFHRAADRLAAATADTLASSDTPAEALVGLVDSYVDLSFRNPEVLSVYFAEIGNLPAAEQKTLRGIQRLNVEEWVALLVQVRPELDSAEARFVVHAALGLVLDVGRLVHFEPGQSERVAQLMRAALGVGAPHDGGGESEPRSEGR